MLWPWGSLRVGVWVFGSVSWEIGVMVGHPSRGLFVWEGWLWCVWFGWVLGSCSWSAGPVLLGQPPASPWPSVPSWSFCVGCCGSWTGGRLWAEVWGGLWGRLGFCSRLLFGCLVGDFLGMVGVGDFLGGWGGGWVLGGGRRGLFGGCGLG